MVLIKSCSSTAFFLPIVITIWTQVRNRRTRVHPCLCTEADATKKPRDQKNDSQFVQIIMITRTHHMSLSIRNKFFRRLLRLLIGANARFYFGASELVGVRSLPLNDRIHLFCCHCYSLSSSSFGFTRRRNKITWLLSIFVVQYDLRWAGSVSVCVCCRRNCYTLSYFMLSLLRWCW